MNIKKKFGQKIKQIRKSNNITQEQLAEIINIEPPNISKIENGLHFPQPENIEKFSKALQVEIKDLFDFEDINSELYIANKINEELKTLSLKELKFLYKIAKEVKLLRVN